MLAYTPNPGFSMGFFVGPFQEVAYICFIYGSQKLKE
jgi:hypothetical protein